MKALLLFLLLPLFAQAGLRGDWESTGAPALPVPGYDPPYSYRYDCQAELGDLVARGESKPYQLVASARFPLERKNSAVSGRELSWSWHSVGAGLESPLPMAPAEAFATDAVWISLRAEKGERPARDKIVLQARVAVAHGAYERVHAQFGRFSRRQETLRVEALASLSRREGAAEPGPAELVRRLVVECKLTQ